MKEEIKSDGEMMLLMESQKKKKNKRKVENISDMGIFSSKRYVYARSNFDKVIKKLNTIILSELISKEYIDMKENRILFIPYKVESKVYKVLPKMLGYKVKHLIDIIKDNFDAVKIPLASPRELYTVAGGSYREIKYYVDTKNNVYVNFGTDKSIPLFKSKVNVKKEKRNLFEEKGIITDKDVKMYLFDLILAEKKKWSLNKKPMLIKLDSDDLEFFGSFLLKKKEKLDEIGNVRFLIALPISLNADKFYDFLASNDTQSLFIKTASSFVGKIIYNKIKEIKKELPEKISKHIESLDRAFILYPLVLHITKLSGNNPFLAVAMVSEAISINYAFLGNGNLGAFKHSNTGLQAIDFDMNYRIMIKHFKDDKNQCIDFSVMKYIGNEKTPYSMKRNNKYIFRVKDFIDNLSLEKLIALNIVLKNPAIGMNNKKEKDKEIISAFNVLLNIGAIVLDDTESPFQKTLKPTKTAIGEITEKIIEKQIKSKINKKKEKPITQSN